MSIDVAKRNDEAGLEEEPISAEIVAVIAAGATVLLGLEFTGSGVRIRSVQQLQSNRKPANRWMQQGRAFVQSSHNLRRKR